VLAHHQRHDLNRVLCGDEVVDTACDCEPVPVHEKLARCVGGHCAAADPPACSDQLGAAIGDATQLLIHHDAMGVLFWAGRPELTGFEGPLAGSVEATGSGFPEHVPVDALDPPVDAQVEWAWLSLRDSGDALWTFAFRGLQTGFGVAAGEPASVDLITASALLGGPGTQLTRLTIDAGGDQVFHYAIGSDSDAALPDGASVRLGPTRCGTPDSCGEWYVPALRVELGEEVVDIDPDAEAAIGDYTVQHFASAVRPSIGCMDAPSYYMAFAIAREQ
jgi:hypothetical protein